MTIPYFSMAKGSRNFIKQDCGHHHPSANEAFKCPDVPCEDYGPGFAGEHYDRIIDHTNQTVRELMERPGGLWSMDITEYGLAKYGADELIIV